MDRKEKQRINKEILRNKIWWIVSNNQVSFEFRKVKLSFHLAQKRIDLLTMFTGIVEGVGKVESLVEEKESWCLHISSF